MERDGSEYKEMVGANASLQASSGQAAALEEARQILANADRVLIGAGAGLSTAAGLDYGGERFAKNFAPFIERYGMTDMYSAGFYPFPTEEDKWAYWSHHAWVNDVGIGTTPLYKDLSEWAAGKDTFVITTNVDRQFDKAGFPAQRIFAPQGDYAHIQCATGRHDEVFDAADIFAAIEEDSGHGARTRITDSSLVPRCAYDGSRMEMHLRSDGTFVQTEEWYEARNAYQAFVEDMLATNPDKAVLLELGVGFNTPVWIRSPFSQIAQATGIPLVRINRDYAAVEASAKRGVGLKGDIAAILPEVIGR